MLVFVEVAHEIYEAAGDVFAHAVYEVDSFPGDLDHDFAAVFAGVEALDVAKLFQAVHQTGGGGGAVTHLLGDVSHSQEILIGEITEEEKLGKGNVPFVQFLGKIEEKGSLGEHDKVSQTSGILSDESVFFF